MAFVSDTNPNAGNNFGDFLINKVLPFLRDNMGWVDNQVPAQSPDMSLGNATSELWTHRGGPAQRPAGSPGVGSPLINASPQALPPFIFWRTGDDVDQGNIGYLFTGFGGTDASQEAFDQPNNPCNSPRVAWTGLQTSRDECQIQAGLNGAYSAYWLFGPGDGSYVHIVLKVASRHYRHFWFGMLDRFSTDVDPNTFYVCGHWWENIAPDNHRISISGADWESQPYLDEQMPPGAAGTTDQAIDAPKHQHRSALYSPGLRSDSPEIDWYYSSVNTGPQSLTKPQGDVNASLDVGNCMFTSYAASLGRTLWQCDESFIANVKPLVPILTFVNTAFEANERWGCIGQVPDVFRINMSGLSAEDEITVGSDTFVIFPVTNNDAANYIDGEPYSGDEGYAYKKILGSP